MWNENYRKRLLMNNKESLFTMRDSWIKYYTYEAFYCGTLLGIFVFIMGGKFTLLFIPLYFIIFLSNMNDEYYVHFYDNKILYNHLDNVTAGFSVKHKEMYIANISSLKIYRHFYGIANNKKPIKNKFFKFLEVIFSYSSKIIMIPFPKILYFLGKAKHKNTNTLMFINENTYEYMVIVLSMLNDSEIENLRFFLLNKFNVDLDNIEIKNFFINFDY